jgi:hypothetical protein
MFNRFYSAQNKPSKIHTGTIAVALMAGLLGACNINDVPNPSASGEAGNVTTEDVAESTDQLLGQTVSIRSNVVRKVGPASFTVDDNEFLNAENILVINASGESTVLPDNTELQITGKVAKFVRADIEREYNLNLEPNLYTEYEGQPAIIAQSIALAPKPGEISTNPSQYYGRVLAVPGEVEDIVSSDSFTLDEDRLLGGEDLLVIVDTPGHTITDGEYVVATGTLRRFVVAELDREYDLTWDLDLQRKLEVEYRDKPVLIATEVYPSAKPPIEK